MPKTKSWEIKKVSCNKDLTTSAKVILHHRVENLLNSVSSYLNEMNEDNLHQLRIVLRRIRYSSELFIKCFNRKKYLSFYKCISSLQDLSGEIRDLDVLKQDLKNFRSSDSAITSVIDFNKIEYTKNKFQTKFKLELMKFIHSKQLKEFKKLIDA